MSQTTNLAVPLAAAAGAYFLAKAADHRFGFKHDLRSLLALNGLKSFVDDKLKTGFNVAKQFLETAGKFPNKDCLIFEKNVYTFKQVDEISNRVANWAQAQGLKKGDTVALLMENRAEFVILWLGLCKVGIRIALLNNNLRLGQLMHCIKVSHASWVIVGTELIDAVQDVLPDLEALKLKITIADDFAGLRTGTPSNYTSKFAWATSMDSGLVSAPTKAVDKKILDSITFNDVWGYIYTSGTTGLPKASIISNLKYWAMGTSFCLMYNVTEKDRIYTPLPMYHSAGGGIGVCMGFYSGAAVIIARKFSASKFWLEATESKATVVQYIGELCRYLLAVPPSPYDKAHKVRIAIGNGLRPDIWEQFQTRFNIPEIGEFYAATEGNMALYNWCKETDERGYIGRQGLLYRNILGSKIVKFNVEKEEPVRGANGFCIPCGFNEPGELIFLIDRFNPLSQFNGYTDPKATEKKLVKDVFKKGDAYFRTGDLISVNERGFYSFIDRIGDTFRWKGENVSTTEVAEVLSKVPGILEANVYGTAVPGADGRACMAACVCSKDLNLDTLLKHVKRELPAYAVPLFIRQLPQIEITGTFKHTKVQLRDEGIDLKKVKDPIIWLSPVSKQYETFDAKASALITSGQAKF